MKNRYFFIMAVCSLLMTSCQKNKPITEKQLDRALKSGYLCNEWILDDDSKKNHDVTQASQAFKNETNPVFDFYADNTYKLTYKSSASVDVVETGTYEVNSLLQTITFHPVAGTRPTQPGQSSDYTFGVYKLGEENLVMTNATTVTTYTTNSEGVSVPTTSSATEKLYFCDND
jgi:hypothetical protein